MTDCSCLCGSVRFSFEPAPASLINCHCNYCRKHHGSSMVTFASAKPEDYIVMAGEEFIGQYQSSDVCLRQFCKRCGTSLPVLEAGMVVIPAGGFTTPVDAKVAGHIYAAHHVPWFVFGDEPRMHGMPGENAHPAAPDLDRPTAAKLNGSCLCDSVRFEASVTPLIMRNCYCGRCRRSRAACNATNLFVPIDKLAFTRGEALLTTYRLPEADRFGACFCGKCGSLMPYRMTTQGVCNIPAGCVDGDPGARPEVNIFVADKPAWIEINDSLPCFETRQPTA